ncbi:hypothetical protein [Mycolicibacterium obuense]|uniref:Uncharacterized protein n=1 Tax=Mycolicibacterium obuense TaxID=1807 RepID=A0A0M2JZ99_9MYCO|nr:hypothetical protein [Mycolicibacterium obuense]KKF01941.1 hypothetical protein WN67_11040 [Mycolicibacterium obuense]
MDYHGPKNDGNRGGGLFTDPRGWFHTGTLRCDPCGAPTRHALINQPDSFIRDLAEQYQRYALGGDWGGDYAPDRERVREEYFAQFPRNPYVHHWYSVDEAQAAWEAGERTVIALCGDTMTLKREPNTCRGGRGAELYELVEPNEVHDVEYEDSETGLWWDDLDCVNCLRVTNERRRNRRRRLLESWLAWFAQHPEAISDSEADALIELFTPLVAALNEDK